MIPIRGRKHLDNKIGTRITQLDNVKLNDPH